MTKDKFFYKDVLQSSTITKDNSTHSCGCVGPQNGQPYCPCRMRGVIIRNGRYVEPERDLGPVSTWDEDSCSHE